jgi:hypothetical protein
MCPMSLAFFLMVRLLLCQTMPVATEEAALGWNRGAGQDGCATLRGQPWLGARIVEFLSDVRSEVVTEILKNRVVGLTDDLPRILDSNVVNSLFFDGGPGGGVGQPRTWKAPVRKSLFLSKAWTRCRVGLDLAGVELLACDRARKEERAYSKTRR